LFPRPWRGERKSKKWEAQSSSQLTASGHHPPAERKPDDAAQLRSLYLPDNGSLALADCRARVWKETQHGVPFTEGLMIHGSVMDVMSNRGVAYCGIAPGLIRGFESLEPADRSA
jgi:hypothetical protein